MFMVPGGVSRKIVNAIIRGAKQNSINCKTLCGNVVLSQSIHIMRLTQNVEYGFSRFGSKEKKIEDLQKQLALHTKKNNLTGMMMTSVKIVKYKEMIHSREFYPGFAQDYIDLAKILLNKRDFEEATTLIEDAIEGAGTDTSDNSTLISLQLQMIEIILSDPSKAADAAFDLIESLKSQSENLSETQKNRLILFESKMYLCEKDLVESFRIISTIPKEITDKALHLEIITFMLDLSIKLQQPQNLKELMHTGSEIAKQQNKNFLLNCIEYYIAEINASIFLNDMNQAETLLVELEQFLEEKQLTDPYYQARLFLLDSQVLEIVGKSTQASLSINKAIANLELTRILNVELGLKILNQKANLLAQEDQLDKALSIFISNKTEMERNKQTESVLYLETVLHVAVLSVIGTRFEQAKMCAIQLRNVSSKFLGPSSEFVIDASIVEGMCCLSQRTSSENEQAEGTKLLQYSLVAFRNSQIQLLWIRVLYFFLLKEIYLKKKMLQEILYINTILESYYFTPRQSINTSEQFKQMHEMNINQTQLLTQSVREG